MEQPSKSFREWLVWQKAHAFTLHVYGLTDTSPECERYGLTSRLRRGSTSIGSNIVEGYRRRTHPDKLRFYNTARGSADECLYQRMLAHDLSCADTTQLQSDAEEVGRLLQGCINGLERNG